MRLRFPLASCLLSLLTLPALADSYPVTGGTADFSGSGTLYATASPSTPGAYTITSITGDGVTGLVAAGGYHGNDNLFYPSQPTLLDPSGFAFTDMNGDTNYTVDIFASGTNAYSAWVSDTDPGSTEQQIALSFALDPAPSTGMMRVRQLAAAGQTEAFQFSFTQTVAQTPEPTSVALLGTGFLGLAGFVRRRKR